MTGDEMQKLGMDGMDSALISLGAWSRSGQAIVAEIADYSKKSTESSLAAWEKLMGAKSLEKAMEVQADYLRSSCEDFVAESTRLGELCLDFAREACRPFESAFAAASKLK